MPRRNHGRESTGFERFVQRSSETGRSSLGAQLDESILIKKSQGHFFVASGPALAFATETNLNLAPCRNEKGKRYTTRENRESPAVLLWHGEAGRSKGLSRNPSGCAPIGGGAGPRARTPCPAQTRPRHRRCGPLRHVLVRHRRTAPRCCRCPPIPARARRPSRR